ncbi:MAG: tetratricopeptide repeat protein [Saprospiraceae bacterium]|nr:tetratricopeptide repeat protein [Saprospiraceae bacterium]MBK9629628.1 tetratricopeptide repeat protein [Saprospiraceae bacterium]
MQDEWMERYLAGELSKDEKASFEKRMQEDSLFKAEVEAYQSILSNLKSVRNQDLKARLITLEGSLPKKGFKFRKAVFYILLFVIILAVSLWFMLSRKSNFSDTSIPPKNMELDYNPSIQEHNPKDAAPAILEDTLPKEVQPKLEPDATKSMDSKNPNAVKDPDHVTYAAHFEPYMDEDLSSMVRGEGEITNYEKFLAFYLKKDYARALKIYNEMDESLRDSDNLLFLKANVLLGLNRSAEAKVLLIRIIKNDQSRYTAEAKKYLRYCR